MIGKTVMFTNGLFVCIGLCSQYDDVKFMDITTLCKGRGAMVGADTCFPSPELHLHPSPQVNRPTHTPISYQPFAPSRSHYSQNGLAHNQVIVSDALYPSFVISLSRHP